MTAKWLHKVMYVALGGVLFAGILLWTRPWRTEPEDPRTTAAAGPRAVVVSYGYVDHRQGPLPLVPLRAGRVTVVLVQEKQTVGEGTPLVQVDDAQAKLQEEEADLNIQAARLQLAKARQGLEQYQAKKAQQSGVLEVLQHKMPAARYYLKVKEKLVKEGISNEDELETARSQIEELRALEKVEQKKLAELEAYDPNLEKQLAQVQLDRALSLKARARLDRDDYVLKAPVAGVVLRVLVQEGDVVSPTSGRPAVVLAPKGNLIVRTEVSQEFADHVREGQPVHVEDEASGKLLGTGKVAEVAEAFLPRRQFSPDPTAVNLGLACECIIVLEDGHAPLRLGQRVRVRFFAPEGGQPLRLSGR